MSAGAGVVAGGGGVTGSGGISGPSASLSQPPAAADLFDDEFGVWAAEARSSAIAVEEPSAHGPHLVSIEAAHDVCRRALHKLGGAAQQVQYSKL